MNFLTFILAPRPRPSPESRVPRDKLPVTAPHGGSSWWNKQIVMRANWRVWKKERAPFPDSDESAPAAEIEDPGGERGGLVVVVEPSTHMVSEEGKKEAEEGRKKNEEMSTAYIHSSYHSAI